MASAQPSIADVLLRLAAVRPQLLADHAAAYASMLACDLERLAATTRRRAFLNMLALCALAVAMALAGVAVMLWASLPVDSMRAPWLLVLVPLLPVVLAAACCAGRRRQHGDPTFDELRRQLRADGAMLRKAAS